MTWGRRRMLKLVGAVLVIFASLRWGRQSSDRLRYHATMLSDLVSSLNMMGGEICTNMSPMCDVLGKLSESGGNTVRPFYRRVYRSMVRLGECSFLELWRGALSELDALTPEELSAVESLGTCLGRYDVNEQAQLISGTTRKLERALREAQERRQRDTKVYAAFSLTAGLLTVIILL